MSAFLGPIHTWLFTKIRFQDHLQKAILEDYEKDKDHSLSDQLDRRYGILEEGELKDIIDGGNIHGWLQERVSLVENRLAFMVTKILQSEPEYMDRIKEIAFEEGRKNAFSHEGSVQGVYKMLDDLLLNGMPCDHVNAIVEESEDTLVWSQTKDIHKPYWDSVGGYVENYNQIRESLITGLLSKGGISFQKTADQSYKLRKVV